MSNQNEVDFRQLEAALLTTSPCLALISTIKQFNPSLLESLFEGVLSVSLSLSLSLSKTSIWRTCSRTCILVIVIVCWRTINNDIIALCFSCNGELLEQHIVVIVLHLQWTTCPINAARNNLVVIVPWRGSYSYPL